MQIKVAVFVNKAPCERCRTLVLKSECVFAKIDKKRTLVRKTEKEHLFLFQPTPATISERTGV
jgi:hypothetical protein